METTHSTELFFKLSLAQWSFHKSILEHKTMDPFDFAAKAKAMGFDAVEYVNRIFELDASNISGAMTSLVKTLKSRSLDNGVKNLLIMVDREGGLASLKKEDRIAAVDLHKKWVDAAAELDCHSVRVNLFGEGVEDYDIWKETAPDGLRMLCEYAKLSGLNVIVENHGGFSSHGARLAQAIKDVNMDNAGTLPDFGNFCIKRAGNGIWPNECLDLYDRYQGVAEMMPFAKGVSAKSYEFDAQGNETTIDFVRMLKIIKDSGYAGYIDIEYEGQQLSEVDGIVATRDLLLKAASVL